MRNQTDTESTNPTRSPEPQYVTLNGFSVRRGMLRLRDRATELNVHPITLKRACDAGALAFVRIGDLRFLSEKHVADWLARLERPARKAA